MRPVSFPSRRVGAALLASSAAAFALGAWACASTEPVRRQEIHAEIVDSREGRTVTGDRLFYLTLAYRDNEGASCTTTVQVDQLTWMRLKGDSEPCIVPYHGAYTVASCR